MQSINSNPGAADLERLAHIIPFTQKTIDEVRRIVKDLRPSILDDLGVIATINWFSREFQAMHAGIRIEQTVGLDETDIPQRLKTVIYRILHEMAIAHRSTRSATTGSDSCPGRRLR